MMKHALLLSSGILSCGLNACNHEEQAQITPQNVPDTRPNILIISSEDMSPRLGCLGDTLARTPNIDRLANLGTRYTRAYSTCPVSAPSRSSIITGMYACAYGGQNMRSNSKTSVSGRIDSARYSDYFNLPLYDAVPPADVRCFSEIMRAHGYYCTNNSKTDYNFKPPVTAWDECSKTAHWRNRPEGKPFFSVFNLMTTHESKIWEHRDKPLVTNPDAVTVPPFFPDTKVIRTDLARLYDNISRMDSAAGRILSMLEEDGLMNNTIIVFYSDHGDGLPRFKRSVYETGLHVPLIIAMPGTQDDGRISTRLVSLMDIAPTVLAWAGIRPPDYMHGIVIADTVPPRMYCHSTADRMDVAVDCSRSVCDSQYRYIRNYMPDRPYVQDIPYRNQMATMQELYRYARSGRLNAVQKKWFARTKPAEELYDLKTDPYNLNNLAGNPKYREVLDRMRKEHEQWKELTGDKGLIPERQMIAELWQGRSQPQTLLPEMYLTDAGQDSSLIALKCVTPGASIGYRYCSAAGGWNVYTQPFLAITRLTDTLEIIAHRIGYKPSPVMKIIFNPVP